MRLKAFFFWLAVAAATSSTAVAAAAKSGDRIAIQDLVLTIPDGWSLSQDAKDQGTIILGFQNGGDYLTFFVKRTTGLDMKSIFANGSEIVRDVRRESFQGRDWTVLETVKTSAAPGIVSRVASFLTEIDGYSYYGYARSATQEGAIEVTRAFLDSVR